MAKFQLEISKEVQQAFKKIAKRDRPLLERIEKQIEKILEFPKFGKPLRHSMKNERRLQVGSFVLVYEVENEVIRLLDFDHHDKIYKKRR